MATPEAQHNQMPGGRRSASSLIWFAIGLAIFVGLVPQIASFRDVVAAMGDLSVSALIWPFLLGALNQATYWWVSAVSLPGLGFWQAARVKLASTSVANTVPAGGAVAVGVTFSMLSRSGFSSAAITRSVLVTGVWSVLVKLIMPVAALAALAFDGRINSDELWVITIGVAAFALIAAIVGFALLNDRNAGRTGMLVGAGVDWIRRLLRQQPAGGWNARAVRFRADALVLLRNRWQQLTGGVLAGYVTLFLLLLVCLRSVGVDGGNLPWTSVFAAFAFVMLISALPLTPGALGIAEFGYAATLTLGAGTLMSARVVAAVLLFRAISYLVPTAVGALSFVTWRRSGDAIIDRTVAIAPAD